MGPLINKMIKLAGFQLSRIDQNSLPRDIRSEFKNVYESCRDYTMTSPERMYALYKATKYVVEAGIPGDLVECGAWKGGSGMIMAKALLELEVQDRKIYLYDTYEGMAKPTEKDRRIKDKVTAFDLWEQRKRYGKTTWNVASLKNVKQALASTGYPMKNLVFVKGEVEETLLHTKPESIPLLHLDTDWYSSTYTELKTLYPHLEKGGVLILDDYGSWQGARDAVDQYFKEQNIHPLLHRIDEAGRLVIK